MIFFILVNILPSSLRQVHIIRDTLLRYSFLDNAVFVSLNYKVYSVWKKQSLNVDAKFGKELIFP